MASTQDEGGMAMVEHKKTVARTNADQCVKIGARGGKGLKAINAIFDSDSDDEGGEMGEDGTRKSSVVFDEIENDLMLLEHKIRRVTPPVISMLVLNAKLTHVRILGHMIPLDDRPMTVEISNIPLLKREGV